MKFRDRADAGRRLAARLAEYEDRFDVLVLALPRGGVPVGFEVASGPVVFCAVVVALDARLGKALSIERVRIVD